MIPSFQDVSRRKLGKILRNLSHAQKGNPYKKNHRFWLDIEIFCLTIVQVLLAKGISHSDQEIMPKFMGTKKDINWNDI